MSKTLARRAYLECLGALVATMDRETTDRAAPESIRLDVQTERCVMVELTWSGGKTIERIYMDEFGRPIRRTRFEGHGWQTVAV